MVQAKSGDLSRLSESKSLPFLRFNQFYQIAVSRSQGNSSEVKENSGKMKVLKKVATLCRSLFFEVMALKLDSFLIVLSSSSVHPNFNRITQIYELDRYFYTSTKLKIPNRFHICGKWPLKSRTILVIYLWRFNWAASENNFKAVSIRFLIRSRKIALTQNGWLHRE